MYRLHLLFLDDVKPIVCALAQCRYLYGNQLTGTLPATWSAMRELLDMWVPCGLLIPLVPSRCGCSATRMQADVCG